MELKNIKPNPDNPRTINKVQFEKLKDSIQGFPEMMRLRPMVVDSDNVVMGGNMRLKALKELGYDNIPDDWVVSADDLTEEQKKEFIVKDNVGFGEWNWEILANEWDADLLAEWGLDVPNITATELLSGLKYDPLYYEPIETPNINLRDCINTEKFDAKIEALEEYELTKEQKEVLKMFAYRFIKIDFERVANYYSFNASEEEQKAIERLRLVLTDNGAEGFLEDDLLRLLNVIDHEITEEDD